MQTLTIHIFYPEHDIALAINRDRFTPSFSVRKLKSDIGFIPALWSNNGDIVIVDDVELSSCAYKHLQYDYKPDVKFMTFEDLAKMELYNDVNIDIDSWGWNSNIALKLKNVGIINGIPTKAQLQEIRRLSCRRECADVLSSLRDGLEKITCGNSYSCTSEEHINSLINKYKNIVIKAPWSSSGRGVRFISSLSLKNVSGWINNIISKQGCIIVEPYYNNIKDFAMEFYSDGKGNINYLGLSVFETINGTYCGNVIATEDKKTALLIEYINNDLLEILKQRICNCFAKRLNGIYKGPFGIDMMIVADNSKNNFLVNPYVELNLRRTMGHIALSLVPNNNTKYSLMRINHDGQSFKFQIINQ
jgi:hypothetical protein